MRIGTLHEGQVLIVHHVFRPDDSLQTLDVGALLPAHASALGKILLADHPYAAGEVARAGLESFTPATITDPEALERELERVRQRGWAADIGELVNGEVSCAAPILDRRGRDGGRDGRLGSARPAAGGAPAARRPGGVRPRGRARSFTRTGSDPLVDRAWR